MLTAPELTPAVAAIYNAIYKQRGASKMERKAKIFFTNRSQAIRLPKEFQFATSEVYIHREGEKIILSPRPANWDDYLAHGAVAPDDFMANIEDLPLQERE